MLRKQYALLGIVGAFVCIFQIRVKADTPRNIYTPRGQLVGDSYDMTEMSESSRKYWDSTYAILYPNATQIKLWSEEYSSSNLYNCHGYAWHMIGDNSINDPVWIGYSAAGNTAQYWDEDDESYSSVDAEYADEDEYESEIIVDYTGDHSAVSTWEEDIYISKWNRYPLMRHGKNYTPGYGSPSLFLRKNPVTPSDDFPTIYSALNDALPGQIIHVDSGIPGLTANIIVPSGKTLKIHTGTTITFNGYYIKVMPGGALIVESGVTFSPSNSYIRYCGTWNSDITWQNFNVQIDSNLTISSGKTLTIYPGTTVKVASGKSITINGTLSANGNSSQSITFTKLEANSWYGIELHDCNHTTLSYCTIENSTYGVTSYDTWLDISHCIFSNNGPAINYDHNAYGTIQYTSVSSSWNYGIYCTQNSTATIRPYNRIWDINGTAVCGDDDSLPELGHSSNNGNNSLKDNYPDDIWSDNYNTLYAENNYWGSSSPDPYVSENVDWDPYLTTDPTAGLYKKLTSDQSRTSNHEKIYSDTTGKYLFSKAYDMFLAGNYQDSFQAFGAIVSDYADFPIAKQALSFANKCNSKTTSLIASINYLDQIKTNAKSTQISDHAKSIKVGLLIKSGSYNKAINEAMSLLETCKDTKLVKYALYDLGMIFWSFLDDKKNGEIYYKRLINDYPKDKLAESAKSTLGIYVPPAVRSLTKTAEKPTTYSLAQNFPNPFNPTTQISYALPEEANVNIKIYNLLGQLVSTLTDRVMSVGYHTIIWNATDTNGQKVSSGLYLCKMSTNTYRKTIKMMLLP